MAVLGGRGVGVRAESPARRLSGLQPLLKSDGGPDHDFESVQPEHWASTVTSAASAGRPPRRRRRSRSESRALVGGSLMWPTALLKIESLRLPLRH